MLFGQGALAGLDAHWLWDVRVARCCHLRSPVPSWVSRRMRVICFLQIYHATARIARRRARTRSGGLPSIRATNAPTGDKRNLKSSTAAALQQTFCATELELCDGRIY